jgi:uncharacterized protein YjiS (DUF1127 family)
MRGTAGHACLDTSGRCPIAQIGKALRPGWSMSWGAFKRWRSENGAVAALEALDERMLKDIGIERSEIESVVRGQGRDPSRVDRT